jgi:hypothetical protein
LPEVANDYVSRVRVEVAANPAATTPNSRLSSAGSIRPKSTMPTEYATFSTVSTHSVTSPSSIAALRKVHSITLSAMESSVGGTSMPSALAALRLSGVGFCGCRGDAVF